MEKEEKWISIGLKAPHNRRGLMKGIGKTFETDFKNFDILERLLITEEVRKWLFLFSEKEIKSIAKHIIRDAGQISLSEIIQQYRPQKLKKYLGSFLLCKGEEELSKILSGEVRNLTQHFFKRNRVKVKSCQLDGCNDNKLQTVHLNERRPIILREAAQRSIVAVHGELKKFDIYLTMRNYLLLHAEPDTICYLCDKHHRELEAFESKGKNPEYYAFVEKIRK